MKVNFSEINLTDIEGNSITNIEINKNVGNIIYKNAKNLNLIPIAQDIYAGKEVNLSVIDLNEIKSLISSPVDGLVAFARKAVLDYIDNIGKE
ncbi:unnamed protein product [marine sediment metagenome]|uniref:Uncharacterized protein n=1 Tax=marine sediment metagenome TaxID=412755 RepID=X0SNL1_9ZZZZ